MALLESTISFGLTYANPKPRRYGVVRADAVLTNSYVASNWFDMSNYAFAALYFNVTRGSITELRWRVEHCLDEDGTDWFERLAEEVTLSEIETAEPPYKLAIAGDVKRVLVVPVLGRHLRVRVRAVGTVAGSSLELSIAGV